MKRFVPQKEVIINCRACQEEITIMLKSFGYGYVGLCPECNGIAYNENDLPLKEEKEINVLHNTSHNPLL